MNDFDVFAVQKDMSELVDAFKDMQDVEDFVLIDGCVSKLTLGKKEVPIQFDKMLYSYDKNILILIMRDSQLSISDIEELMHEKNIRFSKYVCDKQNDSYKYDEELKEISFAGEKKALKRIVSDNKEKGHEDCVYYPNVLGKLELGYLTAEGKYGLFVRMKMSGVVDFEDEIILLLEKQKNVSLNDRQIFDILMDSRVKTLVDIDVSVANFKRPKNNKELVKNN